MYADLSRRISLAFLVTFLGISVPVRILAYQAIERYRRGLIIVGSRGSAKWIVDALRNPVMQCYRLVGFVDADSAAGDKRWYGYPVWSSVSDVERICIENDVQEVVVDNQHEGESSILDAALSCLRIGCRVTNQSTFFEKAFGQIPVEHITPGWFLFADLQVYHVEKTTVKRLFDLFTSLVGLVLTLPFWPLIAMVVWIDSGRPILYSQLRVGQNGTLFRLYKFRTMRVEDKPVPTWTADHDPRITRVGRILRKSHLDELPQLWNILCGQMSLIGPRPEQPSFVKELAAHIPYYNERHLIKPGLTGWAQINFGYGNSVEDARRKLQLDLYYVKHMSLELDLTILFRTFGKLFHNAV
jgi:exopolysaccharide biosynthesis polyprenyl glycosylphosphotransferase